MKRVITLELEDKTDVLGNVRRALLNRNLVDEAKDFDKKASSNQDLVKLASEYGVEVVFVEPDAEVE